MTGVTWCELKDLVGRTFERDGERRTVAAVSANGGERFVQWDGGLVSQRDWNIWLREATEVNEERA